MMLMSFNSITISNTTGSTNEEETDNPSGRPVAVYGHECKDFKLSASDQSVIDMMKHYLHTSRKTECSDDKLSNSFKVDQHFLKVFSLQYFEKQNISMQIICKQK
jgi:hypothetical protein